MNRAEFIKTVSAFAAITILPIEKLFSKTDSQKLHLIGLGDAGASMIKYCFEKDRYQQYTIINTEFKEKHNSGINLVEFERPLNAYSGNNPSFKKVNIEAVRTNNSLQQNIESLFSDTSKHYVLFSSLGGFTGSFLSLKLSNQLKQKDLKYTTIINIPPYVMSPFRRCASLEIKEEFNNIPNTYFFDSEELRTLFGNYRLIDQNVLSNQEIFKIFKEKVSA